MCNREKSDRRGGAILQPLGIPEYPWEVVGIDYIFANLPKSNIHCYTYALLWFVTLIKWLTLFHVTRKSLHKIQHVYLSVIVTDYMVSLRLLCLTNKKETSCLLGRFGRALWER